MKKISLAVLSIFLICFIFLRTVNAAKKPNKVSKQTLKATSETCTDYDLQLEFSGPLYTEFNEPPKYYGKVINKGSCKPYISYYLLTNFVTLHGGTDYQYAQVSGSVIARPQSCTTASPGGGYLYHYCNAPEPGESDDFVIQVNSYFYPEPHSPFWTNLSVDINSAGVSPFSPGPEELSTSNNHFDMDTTWGAVPTGCAPESPDCVTPTLTPSPSPTLKPKLGSCNCPKGTYCPQVQCSQ